MHKFVRGLITEWRRLRLPFENAAFVVAVSGGADSVSLLLGLSELHQAKKLSNRFVAAHFNHKLRGEEADTDQEFVRQLAGTVKFELVLGHTHLSEKGNLEQNARLARYEFLRKTAERIGAEGVITAHTQDDQAETFLMNLIRGSGPGGLGGMKPVREMADGTSGNSPGALGKHRAFEPAGREEMRDDSSSNSLNISSPLLPFATPPLLLFRPLLNWARRQDTEGYCRDREVEYRYDSMNEDLNFTRVRIRKLLLPMLEEFNPKIVETLSNTARLMQGALDTQIHGNIDAERVEQPVLADANPNLTGELNVKQLKTLEKPELYRILRQWLVKRRGNSRGLTLKHIEAIERLALSRKSGRFVELPGRGTVTRSGGTLVYAELKVEKRPSGN